MRPSFVLRLSSAAVVVSFFVGLAPTMAVAADEAVRGESFTTASSATVVPAGALFGGVDPDAMTVMQTGPLRANEASVPYVGSMTVDPSTVTNYDFFASGVTVTAAGLGVNERAIITDTSPNGEVFTFDPVKTNGIGSVTATVRRYDRVDPQVGMHRLEITSADGSQAGALLEVTLSERLNAEGKATPDRLTADQFHDDFILVEGSGFIPGEPVSAHATMPDLSMTTIDRFLQADGEGKVRYYLQAASAAVTPGAWQLTFLGEQSTRNGIANFFVDHGAVNVEVGSIETSAATLRPSEFDKTGLGFRATGLPAFGLFDLELRNANNRDVNIGRYRADGDGTIEDTIYGANAAPGQYRLGLTNVDTADYAHGPFTVTREDGSLAPEPVMSVTPSTLEPESMTATGLTVTANGYEPGETVELTIRDQYRKKLLPSLDTIPAKQADSNGAVQFTFLSRAVPDAGAWEVAVGATDYLGLIQRTTVTVTTDEPAPQPEPEQPGTEEPGTGTPNPEPGTGGEQPTEGADVTLPPNAGVLLGQTAQSWFVELEGDGALEYPKVSTKQRSGVGKISASQRVEVLDDALDDVVDAAAELDEKAQELYKTVWTVPGVAVRMDTETADTIAERDDVVSVTPIVTKHLVTPVETGATPANSASNELTGASQTWRDTGFTGEGTTIAVIDTGVDYTHADFGGPGGDGRSWAIAGTQFDGMPPVDSGLYDPSVIVPGYDFAGPVYDADSSSASYSPIPRPDSNPIDGPGGGHGTHVAGTAAGRGVDAEGATFDGDYANLSDEDMERMNVAPGSAPQAKIMPLKVFGDNGGSTDLAGAALDWAAGQIAQGQDIDVINMSLGSSFTAADDPENKLVDRLTELGVVVVISAGNSGDITDVAGSPGNASSSLAVAAVSSGFSRFDLIQSLSPDGSFASHRGQFTQSWPAGPVDITGPVVALSEQNSTGCATFGEADRTLAQGKIVWLEWDENAVSLGQQCGSAQRFIAAADAGAAGVVLTSTLDLFEGQVSGDDQIPGGQLTASETAALRPMLDAGTLVLRFASANAAAVDVNDPRFTDAIAGFSSRGVHGSVDDIIKPDVSAPGVNVVSASKGTGTGSESMSGTSMAAPHTAGIAALVSQAHPKWDALRVKNAIMNTALAPVLSAPDGVPVSPLRSGTGRVDAQLAVDTDITAASAENGSLLSASFGVVEVPEEGISDTRTVTVTNSSTRTVVYTVSIEGRTTTPGATLSVDTTTVTVPAEGTADVSVKLAVPDPTALRRTTDPGMEQNTETHISDISGILTFTPATADAPTLGLTVFAAPKPVSDLTAANAQFAAADAETALLDVSGTYLAQNESNGGSDYAARVTPLIAGATSPVIDVSDSASKASLSGADVIRTGAASTSPQHNTPSTGVLAIGIETAGPMIGLGATTIPLGLIDANRDGRDDFAIYPELGQNGVATVSTVDLGTQRLLDSRPLNDLASHTNQHDSDTLVLTATLNRLGYTDTTSATTIAYRVQTISQYAPLSPGGARQYDLTPRALLNVYNPAVSFDTGGATTATVNPDTITLVAGSEAAGALMLIAHDNTTGDRVLDATWSTQDAPALTGIEITTMPNKTHYLVGDSFDSTGLVVSAIHGDGAREVIDLTQVQITGFDSTSPGDKALTVDTMINGVSYTTSLTVTIGTDTTTPSNPPTPNNAPGEDAPTGSGSGSGALAITGSSTGPWVGLAAVLLLIGGVLATAVHIRRSRARA